MKSVIDELWYGNICPHELRSADDDELKKLSQRMAKKEDELERTLDDKQRELFERLMKCRDEYDSVYEAKIFSSGFKLGAEFMLEIAKGKN